MPLKIPPTPFRVAIDCAMWLTGFDVECLQTPTAKKLEGHAKVRLGVCCRGEWKPGDVWVVYKHPANPMTLRSSEMVVVCKRTGRILYDGSAGDGSRDD
jgi:hypothetical protein